MRLTTLLLFSWSLGFAQLIDQKEPVLQTDIFIHTSKPYYTPGEKIWFSAYLFNDATGNLLKLQHPLYVQFYAPDGQLITNEQIFTNAGRGAGTLTLQPSTPPGIYRLRAFTQSMALARQPDFEKVIYVGVLPATNLQAKENQTSELLQIGFDSDRYSVRSPVEISLKHSPGFEASLSVTVFKELYETRASESISSMEFNNSNAAEKTEQLLYMGRAFDFKGHLVKDGQVILSIMGEQGQQTFMAETNAEGFFIFSDLIFEGEQKAYWQVNNKKGKPVANASLRWIKFPPVPQKIEPLIIDPEDDLEIIQLPAVYQSDGDSVSFQNTIALEEVGVTAKRQTAPNLGVPVLHNAEDVTFTMDFKANTFTNGYSGTEHNFKQMLKFLPTCYGFDPPKYFVDGIEMQNPEEFLDLGQVKRIELLRGATGWVYGTTCVYFIYTHIAENNEEGDNPQLVTIKGFQPTQTFYNPDFSVSKKEEPDGRQTLYWNPDLYISPNEVKKPIRFYTSDMTGNYRVLIHGVSNLGPIFSVKSFQVE